MLAPTLKAWLQERHMEKVKEPKAQGNLCVASNSSGRVCIDCWVPISELIIELGDRVPVAGGDA
jgi:hypothetical protein